MVFQDFLSFLVFLETSEVAGPGPNPREIDISFGADGPLKVLAPAATVRSRVAQNKFLPKTRDYCTPLLLAVPHCPPGYSEPPRPSTHRFLVASARYAIVSRCVEHGLTMLLERLARSRIFVKRSAVFSSVPRYLTVTNPAPRISRNLNNLRSMWRVCCD